MSKFIKAGRQICVSVASKRCGVTRPKTNYGPMEVQRTTLMNGIRVAAAKPMGNQTAACTVMYNAGSRYETDDQLGATHFIRACINGSGCGYSSFAKTRVIQQFGGYVTCSSDRQSIAFTLRCPLSSFAELKSYFVDMAVRCCYNQWEVDDRKPIISDHLAMMHPEQRALDLVQKACWTGSLANPIFCEEGRVHSMSGDSLNCFASTHFKVDRCTVASVGLPFDATLNIAETIQYYQEDPSPPCISNSCPRGGFELYDLGPDTDTWIAVAVPGTGTCDFPCLLKHSIVAAACGSTDLQRGQHSLDKIPEQPIGLMAGVDIFTEYKAFNISYMDTGVFGILAKSRACGARSAAVAAAEFLANVGQLDFKQIEIGKKRLKVSLALHDEDSVLVSEGLALQLANDVQLDNARCSVAMIDSLCADEIKCVAENISKKREHMAVAVVGDVSAAPHDRELVCG